MTKHETAQVKLEWARAVLECRIIRFDGGALFKMYPTKEERDAALAKFRADGVDAEPVEKR